MKLIKQQKFGECGIACIAMVAGEKYECIKNMFPDNIETIGCTPDLMINILKDLRFKNVKEILGTPIDIETRPAILTVASLNYPGLLHYIVWDGNGNYLDPANGKTYPNDVYKINNKIQVFAATSIIWELENETNL